MAAAKPNRDLYHRRHDGDAFGIAHDLVGNCLFFHAHNLVENLGGVPDALLDVRIIVFRLGRSISSLGREPAHTAKQHRCCGQRK